MWRRVASQPKNDLDQSGVGGMFDISLGGSGGTLTHPPLSLTSAKEMWIFWYGEEPDLTDLVSPELLKSSGMYFFLLNFLYCNFIGYLTTIIKNFIRFFNYT